MFKHVLRNYPLITREEQIKLENTRVAIAGVGGIGGWVADTLVRMGIGHINLSDLDNYEVHNLNRQAYSNMDVLGKPKVHIVAQELKKINNNLDIKIFDEGVNEMNINEFLDGVDIVIDAVEYFEFKVRRLIQNQSRKRGITTFLNVVAGFSVGLFIFSSESMEFDEYIGFKDSSKNEDEFVMPFERTIPVFPKYMLNYCDMNLAKQIFSRQEPITNLCAPVAMGALLAANEVIMNLLGRKNMILAPSCLILDLYENKFSIVNAVENPLWSKQDLYSECVVQWD